MLIFKSPVMNWSNLRKSSKRKVGTNLPNWYFYALLFLTLANLLFISSLKSYMVLFSHFYNSKFTIYFPSPRLAKTPRLTCLKGRNFPNTIFPFKSSASFITYAPALPTMCISEGFSSSGYVSINWSTFSILISTFAWIIP